MKRLPLLIGIVFTVVIVLLAGVFVYQSMIAAPRAAEQNTMIQKTLPQYEKTTNGKPKSSFTSGDSASAAGENQDASTLLNEVDQSTSSVDADLQTLQTDVNGL